MKNEVNYLVYQNVHNWGYFLKLTDNSLDALIYPQDKIDLTSIF